MKLVGGTDLVTDSPIRTAMAIWSEAQLTRLARSVVIEVDPSSPVITSTEPSSTTPYLTPPSSELRVKCSLVETCWQLFQGAFRGGTDLGIYLGAEECRLPHGRFTDAERTCLRKFATYAWDSLFAIDGRHKIPRDHFINVQDRFPAFIKEHLRRGGFGDGYSDGKTSLLVKIIDDLEAQNNIKERHGKVSRRDGRYKDFNADFLQNVKRRVASASAFCLVLGIAGRACTAEDQANYMALLRLGVGFGPRLLRNSCAAALGSLTTNNSALSPDERLSNYFCVQQERPKCLHSPTWAYYRAALHRVVEEHIPETLPDSESKRAALGDSLRLLLRDRSPKVRRAAFRKMEALCRSGWQEERGGDVVVLIETTRLMSEVKFTTEKEEKAPRSRYRYDYEEMDSSISIGFPIEAAGRLRSFCLGVAVNESAPIRIRHHFLVQTLLVDLNVWQSKVRNQNGLPALQDSLTEISQLCGILGGVTVEQSLVRIGAHLHLEDNQVNITSEAKQVLGRAVLQLACGTTLPPQRFLLHLFDLAVAGVEIERAVDALDADASSKLKGQFGHQINLITAGRNLIALITSFNSGGFLPRYEGETTIQYLKTGRYDTRSFSTEDVLARIRQKAQACNSSDRELIRAVQACVKQYSEAMTSDEKVKLQLAANLLATLDAKGEGR